MWHKMRLMHYPLSSLHLLLKHLPLWPLCKCHYKLRTFISRSNKSSREDEWVATLLPHCRLDKALHDLISAREVVSRDEVHRSGRQRNDAREMVSEYISVCDSWFILRLLFE